MNQDGVNINRTYLYNQFASRKSLFKEGRGDSTFQAVTISLKKNKSQQFPNDWSVEYLK